jgi:hypothetical protein
MCGDQSNGTTEPNADQTRERERERERKREREREREIERARERAAAGYCFYSVEGDEGGKAASGDA